MSLASACRARHVELGKDCGRLSEEEGKSKDECSFTLRLVDVQDVSHLEGEGRERCSVQGH